MRAIFLGAGAAFFFAFTFIINRAMDMDGGSWIWSSSLRYYFMLLFLLIIVGARKNIKELLIEMSKHPGMWMIWSVVGFGLFYAPLTFASSYGPGWLIAGTWQMTILSGSLLAPFFYEYHIGNNGERIRHRGRIPWRGMVFSVLILFGVLIMQLENASSLSLKDAFLCIIPILIASFAYPLGNRKMMHICGGRLDAYQRVLGMTMASMPFWIPLSIVGLVTDGLPTTKQVVQSGSVALFSGVFATVLFFAATDLVKDHIERLGTVEATQSLEVLFAAIGEMIFLGSALPSLPSWIGMGLVMLGMVLHSYFNAKIAQKTVPSRMADEHL
ncbi:multidrug resistance efflux transporter family protein [Bacillus sp. 1P06AnD]|uniref:DMT family transporter n=1 Tax=Bacillus sp. 1P06AnD TaxID=3132208 RepID=UPI0039A373AC